MNLFASVQQRISRHAAAAANAPALTAQQIVAVLRSMDANAAEKLHWQTSIADLMIESWQ
jgi:hypothetical protein